MPNLLILGAAKAGTTTLYDLIKQHPQAHLSFDKEPMFFTRDDYFSRGMEWYVETYFSNSEKYTIRGEASPHYLYWAAKAVSRIRKFYRSRPPKFLIVLRNPIERAYSWYWNMMADERESLPFLKALQMEESRIRENWTELEYYGSMQYGYYRGGCYATQIKRYFDEFPSEQFLIIFQEDLIQDQRNIMKRVCSFLGMDPDFAMSPSYKNVSAQPRIQSLHKFIRTPSSLKVFFKLFVPPDILYKMKSRILKANMQQYHYPEMELQVRLYLIEKFMSEITQLSEILGRDLSSWLQP